MNEGELITPTTAARMVGCERNTLLRWSELSICPKAIAINNQWRFKRSEIQKWLDAGCPNAFKPVTKRETIIDEDGMVKEMPGTYSPAKFTNSKISNQNPLVPSLDKGSGDGKVALPPVSAKVMSAKAKSMKGKK